MNRNVYIFYIFALEVCCTTLQNSFLSNKGTEFVFAFMEHYSTSYDDLFFTVINTNSFSVKVNATSPLISNGISEINFDLDAYDYSKIDVDDYKFELSGTEVESRGISVTSSGDVVVLGFNRKRYSDDAFVAIPTDVIGTEYIAVTYCEDGKLCQIGVVANNDNTDVQFDIPNTGNTISITKGGHTYGNGDTISVSLSKYETFQIQSSNDLTGVIVSSNYPISAFSGAARSRIFGGNLEHFVDTLVPTTYLGREYIIKSSFGNYPIRDNIKIVTAHTNTTVKIDNGTLCIENIFTIKGEWYRYTLPTEYLQIYSNHPIIVAHFTIDSAKDGSLVFTTPTEQFDSEYFLFAPGTFKNSWSVKITYENYLTLIAERNATIGFLLDGTALASSTTWTEVGNTGYVATTLKLPTFTDGIAYRVSHQDNVTFGGYLYGKAESESFAMPLGSRFIPIEKTCSDSSINTPNCVTVDANDISCEIHSSTIKTTSESSSTTYSDSTYTSIDTTYSKSESTTSMESTAPSTSNVHSTVAPVSTETETSLETTTTGPDSSVGSTTGSSEHSSTPNYQSTSNTYSSSQNPCVCQCSTSKVSPYSGLTLSESLDKIKTELIIDKKTTSSAKRKLISASDKRISATTAGGVGVAIIALVFGGLVFLDIANIKSQFKILINNVCSRNDL